MTRQVRLFCARSRCRIVNRCCVALEADTSLRHGRQQRTVTTSSGSAYPLLCLTHFENLYCLWLFDLQQVDKDIVCSQLLQLAHGTMFDLSLPGVVQTGIACEGGRPANLMRMHHEITQLACLLPLCGEALSCGIPRMYAFKKGCGLLRCTSQLTTQVEQSSA